MERLDTDDRYIYGAYIRKVVARRGKEKVEFAIYKRKDKFLEAISKCES